MKIWYQSYSFVGFDHRYDYYQQAMNRHVARVARPDTEVHLHGLAKRASKMTRYRYFQYLHAAQAFENALQAEREGYDAFVLGGMLDLGFFELREIVNIPMLFIAETSIHMACLLAPNFSVIGPNDEVLSGIEACIDRYKMGKRYIPGTHLGPISEWDLVQKFGSDPKAVIDTIAGVARRVIDRGAAMIVPGFGVLSLFMVEHGVREIDGVPVLDNTTVLIKSAETLVDMKRAGMLGSRASWYPGPSKQELLETRKLYGVG